MYLGLPALHLGLSYLDLPLQEIGFELAGLNNILTDIN